MTKIMESIGECEAAESGKEAIVAFKTAWEFDLPFDLILLDIEMPDISGIDVLKKVRDIEKENNIPKEKQVKILMVTSHTEHENVVESIKAGCNNYIVKPFNKEKVVRKLEGLDLKVD